MLNFIDSFLQSPLNFFAYFHVVLLISLGSIKIFFQTLTNTLLVKKIMKTRKLVAFACPFGTLGRVFCSQ